MDPVRTYSVRSPTGHETTAAGGGNVQNIFHDNALGIDGDNVWNASQI